MHKPEVGERVEVLEEGATPACGGVCIHIEWHMFHRYRILRDDGKTLQYAAVHLDPPVVHHEVPAAA